MGFKTLPRSSHLTRIKEEEESHNFFLKVWVGFWAGFVMGQSSRLGHHILG